MLWFAFGNPIASGRALTGGLCLVIAGFGSFVLYVILAAACARLFVTNNSNAELNSTVLIPEKP
jgi:hypothetical protein